MRIGDETSERVTADNDLGYLLHRCARLLRGRLGASLREVGLTAQQAAALIALATNESPSLTHKAIGAAIDADAATTTGLLSRLERDGWLASARNASDGRSRIFSLTAKARANMPGVFVAAREASSSATAVLSAAELDTLVGLLGRLANQPEAAGEAGAL